MCGSGVCVVGGMHGRGLCMVCACMAGGARVAGEMATAADGTHPTGVHSCKTLEISDNLEMF